MDLEFTATDDIKFEVEQWWTVKPEGAFPTDHIEASKSDIADFKKDGTRTVRMRLRNKNEGQFSLRFAIDHKNPEQFKPPAPVEPVTFGNVRFDYRTFQGRNNNAHINIDFDIVNTGSKTIGVALHGPTSLAYAGQVEMIGSLTDSEGAEYFIDEMNGIRSMHTVTANLAAIGARETRHVSLSFTKRSTIFTQATTPPTFTLRCEVVINDDMIESGYPSGYIAPNGSLPSGCRIENIIWRIPVRYSNQE
jgi:hypothetical protein